MLTLLLFTLSIPPAWRRVMTMTSMTSPPLMHKKVFYVVSSHWHLFNTMLRMMSIFFLFWLFSGCNFVNRWLSRRSQQSQWSNRMMMLSSKNSQTNRRKTCLISATAPNRALHTHRISNFSNQYADYAVIYIWKKRYPLQFHIPLTGDNFHLQSN